MEIAYNCDLTFMRCFHYLILGLLSDCSGIQGRRLSFSCWDVAIKKNGLKGTTE